MADHVSLVALVAGTFLLAGLVKGVIGLGLPTVAMGLLGLAMPPVEAAAMLLVPSLVTNVQQLLSFRTAVNDRPCILSCFPFRPLPIDLRLVCGQEGPDAAEREADALAILEALFFRLGTVGTFVGADRV